MLTPPSDSTVSARPSTSSRLSVKVRFLFTRSSENSSNSGHFGKVYKVENKFDHRVFAIKQIKIKPKEDLDKVLQEVKNLSKVGKNKNIVKYLDCFLVQEEWREDDCECDHCDDCDDCDCDSGDSFTRSLPGSKSSKSHTGYSSTITCLYIKMEFCHFTLEQLLDLLRVNKPQYPTLQGLFDNTSKILSFKENKKNTKFGAFCPLYMIYQLLDGLVFIHSLGILHRCCCCWCGVCCGVLV